MFGISPLMSRQRQLYQPATAATHFSYRTKTVQIVSPPGAATLTCVISMHSRFNCGKKVGENSGAVIGAEVVVLARIFWMFGAGLSVLAILHVAVAEPEVNALIDYRTWLLLAFAILAMAIGNFSRISGDGR